MTNNHTLLFHSDESDATSPAATLSARAMRSADDVKAGLCTSGLIRLQVSFPALSEGDELSVVCLNADWHLMARDVRVVTRRMASGRRLSFRLRSELIWTPGRYSVVLFRRDAPRLLLTFDYRGLASTPCRVRPLADTDPACWMARHLLGDVESKWEQLERLVGLASLVPGLSAIAARNAYNCFCRERQLPQLMENCYVAVADDDRFRAKCLGYCLPRVLDFCAERQEMMDAEEWLLSDIPADLLANRENVSITLYNIGVLATPRGRSLLTLLEQAVAAPVPFWSLVLCGTEDEIRSLLEHSPALAGCIAPDHCLTVGPASKAEALRCLQSAVSRTPFRLEAAAEDALARQVDEHFAALSRRPRGEWGDFVTQSLVPRFKKRLREEFAAGHEPDARSLLAVKACDVALDDWLRREETLPRLRTEGGTDERLFSESMAELHALTGLSSLKESLDAAFCQVRFAERRRRLGLAEADEQAHHMVFTGNPGTGKTTVARLLGRIFHALGLLSRGEVIVTGRGDLVGEYIGQTEERLRTLLQRARGNVLFIDEAYSLCTEADDRRDFGRHVVEGLLPVLAEPKPDMLVVLAGYGDEMERLFQSNPGLRGRFPHHFRFEDYDAGELMQIARRTLRRGDYRLTPEADAALCGVVAEALRRKDRYFSNARWMNRFISSGILPTMARRVMQGGQTDDADLYRTVQRADVEQAARVVLNPAPSLVPARPRIGFRA